MFLLVVVGVVVFAAVVIMRQTGWAGSVTAKVGLQKLTLVPCYPAGWGP